MKNILNIFGFIVYLGKKIFNQKPQLSLHDKQSIRKRWRDVIDIQDSTKKIIEAEKVMVFAMKALGYTGTFAEQLQKLERDYGRKQSLWNAHKIRNRIVHESGIVATQKDAKHVEDTYYRCLQQFL